VDSKIPLSVVVPAYNEEGRLPATLARIASFLQTRPDLLPAEIVVVDDGSADATAEVVDQVTAGPGIAVHLVRLERHRGKGAGVRAGLAASTGARVLISDADLATPIEEIDALIASGVDLASGSRAVNRGLIARRQPLARDLLGRLFNLGLRVLGLTTFRDTQCGFKLLDGELARRLAGELRLDGFAFDVELLARAARHGASIAEVPVRWYHVDESRVHPLRHGVQMLRDAVRVRLWLWRRR
jgi:dolichyl-phosphate beta-glucosyltransferase